jgi:hypothetical protein
MIETVVAFLLSNYSLTYLLIGLLVAAGVLVRHSRPLQGDAVVEVLLKYYVLFALGCANLHNFVMHVFFGNMSARFIGWEQSPFQAEVGFASLGFAAVSFFAYRRGLAARAAAVIGPSFFSLGAAGGHVYQMITAHNFAPGNAGVVFYTDIGIPILGFALLWRSREHRRRPV